ncbi:glycosyltransferase [Vulcanococcus limneticus Candia 3F8]|uniref:glycosyltransferase family 2 protein n=1 Tax=Vulcanococcus limneticus TaxID=2170428 RepID=UPI000B99B9CD|nr:glycosyltransferase family 2 protein [Vulcanococcus limneticus]MCP9790352.1 glycosyltransferase [Vulcanococcus limneticus MW73D5]MCP9892427.1 glycosyltransferase [Vulcanococcus limneticus Candia 3F8]MCP9895751.1 glycosyltransferase [Vulcanococcus limneticus Candia 3B3]
MTGPDHSAVVQLQALYRQAESVYAAGDAPRAESLLRQFLDLQPHHGAAHHLLGKVLAEREAWGEALDHQRRSCRLHPELGWNWFATGELLLRQQAWAEAVLSFERAAAALPTEAWIRLRVQKARLQQHCGGEDLTMGLGPAAYQYWLYHHEPRLPATALNDSWWWLDQAGRWQGLHGSAHHDALPVETSNDASSPWPCQGWMLLLDPQSRLRAGALQAVEAWLADQPSIWTPHLLYSDEDRLAPDGQRLDPWFKPQWCPDSFFSTPWLERLSLWRVTWLRDQGLPLPPSESGARFRWILDALSRDPVIGHVPRILVHQLADPGAPASSALHSDRAAALHDHLRRQGEAIVEVTPTGPEGFRLIWAAPRSKRCELIIPTRDRADLLSPCLESLWRTAGPGVADLDVRIVVVDNGSQEAETATLFERWRTRLADRFTVLTDSAPFNWSRLNNRAAKLSQAELLVFLNNDVEAPSPGWLEAMVAQALRPAIGCAGALLTYPDGSLQHVGVVVGMHGAADHAYRGLPLEHRVHRARSSYLSNWGAVTGACMAVRRNLFERIGGFDEALPVEFNDIDFCLRLGSVGYRHLVVPEARLIHRESQSRDAFSSPTLKAAIEIMRRRWKTRLENGYPWWPPACARDCGDGRPKELNQ